MVQDPKSGDATRVSVVVSRGMDSSAPELWELVGPTYRLPVMVSFDHPRAVGLARVGIPYGIPLLRAQREVLEKDLTSICAKRENKGWVLKEETLNAYCQKSQFTDPQDVVVWNWSEPKPNEASGFITAYCKHRDALISDRGQAAIIWASFCKFALHRLLRENRKVDLGFGVICALPLRKNWLDVLSVKYRQCFAYKRFDEKEWFQKYITSPILTALDRDTGLLKWTLAIEPSESFEATISAMEKERRKQCVANYPVRIRNLITAHRNRIHELFKSYLAEKDVPTSPMAMRKRGRSARNGEGTVDDAVEQTKATGRRDMDGTSGLSGILEKGAAESLAGEDASVHEVSDILQETENVRRPDQEREMGEAGNRHAGIARLLLPPSVEEQAPRELLAGGTGEWNDAINALATGVEFIPTRK